MYWNGIEGRCEVGIADLGALASRSGSGGVPVRSSTLRILFLVSAHNGLSQRTWIALRELGHEVMVAVVDTAAAMEAAVAENAPELVVCPFLKTMIPASIWSRYRCLIVHPGPAGDRGPSSLDWAIELGAAEWGVTVLEANGEFDAGRVLATRSFPVREARKSSLYRHEVRRAAVEALTEAIGRIAGTPAEGPVPALPSGSMTGRARPLMSQSFRAIDWERDGTEAVLRKLRAAEGHPGVLDTIGEFDFFLFGGHRERVLRGRPGEIIAQRTGAICRATRDGAVWITHLKRHPADTERTLKLPATRALSLAGLELDSPEVIGPSPDAAAADSTYREIVYQERGPVGYLHFEFYNGAMDTEQCERLRQAYHHARSRPRTRVIVLAGGRDYFSNGIHLGVIEASPDPATASWRNLHAINDLVRDIIQTDSHLVVSALGGDAGAGGVPLALAADYVVARTDVILNPYYQHMGGLYGSEYWTYLLPRRVGPQVAAKLTSPPFTPVGAAEAVRIGLLDDTFGDTLAEFRARTDQLADRLVRDGHLERRLEHKRWRRAVDERRKPLEQYRAEELARSYESFFGPDPSYHAARQRFVYKLKPSAVQLAASSPCALRWAPTVGGAG
jgi:putative two-component system protein, hydrogenase maturation factor HypX/HoxX